MAVVEDTIKFRQQIKSIYYLAGCAGEVATAVVYGGRNYLAEMKGDTQFLRESKLGLVFNFSSKPDPFLLVPATPYPVAKGASK